MFKIPLIAMLVMFFIGGETQALSGRQSPSGGTPIPAAATVSGYTNHTFSTATFSTSNVDMSLTYANGFQWYLTNFFGGHTPSSAVTLNADGSLSSLYAGNGNGSIASIGQIASSPFYVGTAFGCGAYITAEISFDPSTVLVATGWPAWWTMAAEHLVSLNQNWSGQASNYDHFIEMDTFEFDLDQTAFPHAYASTLHDWYGIFNSTCSAYCQVASNFNNGVISVPIGTDFSIYHRVAALWVPATVSVSGYVKFFFDDIQIGPGFSWTQFTTQGPPPTTLTPWTFGVIDQQHLALLIGSGSGTINVRSVDVWQGAGACNITN